MRCYLDSNIVMYFVENRALWAPTVAARFAAMRSRGDTLVTSDLARMECRIGPLRRKDLALLADFDAFFAAGVFVASISAEVCDRAAEIRATFGFTPMDAIHLAAAMVSGCEVFLTNDARLGSFSHMTIETLS